MATPPTRRRTDAVTVTLRHASQQHALVLNDERAGDAASAVATPDDLCDGDGRTRSRRRRHQRDGARTPSPSRSVTRHSSTHSCSTTGRRAMLQVRWRLQMTLQTMGIGRTRRDVVPGQHTIGTGACLFLRTNSNRFFLRKKRVPDRMSKLMCHPPSSSHPYSDLCRCENFLLNCSGLP